MAATLRLKVAGLTQQDVGKGIVRIGRPHLQQLGVQRGDVLELHGQRSTAAIAVPAYPQDEGLDVVRMDGLVRTNAGVGIGEPVELARAAAKPARKVVLAPASQGWRISGSGEGLRSTLLHRPVTVGDRVSTSVFRQPSPLLRGDVPQGDPFRAFLETRAYGLMEIRLVVAATVPKGVVRIGEATEIELVPEYDEAAEGDGGELTYDDLGGLDEVVPRIREMIELPLKHPELFERLGIRPPRGVLLHGPPGTGKTLLARAVANETDAHFTSISGPEIMGKHHGESEERLRQLFETAQQNAPAILFIDELDSIAPKRDEVTGEVERRIVAQLLTLLDGLRDRRGLVVIGATNRVDAIDEALRRPGRFDREILIRIPDQAGRQEILQIHTRGMPLDDDVSLEDLAGRTHGFSGSDIAALAREAALATLRRCMPDLDLEQATFPPEVLARLVVDRADFDQGLREVQPSALREIAVEIPNVSWADVGGLEEAKQALHERIELPLKNPEAFRRLGIRSPKGVLLYGPPGTGKTLLAKAVATEAGANFLTAKGSALLSKWYGESEKKIAEFFRRARQVTPAILFFDELDSLVPVRGGSPGDAQVNERVVNQMLSEMDGMEELHGVAVLGATNRPDMLDPALLRPGRFDELIFVTVPTDEARRAIFAAHTRKMKLAADVDIERLAGITAHFTGADISAVCMNAGLLALRENADAQEVTMEHFYQATSETIPSVTEEAVQEYEKLARKVKQQAARIGF